MADNLPVVIVGAGGHGRVIYDSLRHMGTKVLGFLDTNKPIGTKVRDLTVIGHHSDVLKYSDRAEIIIGIGDNWIRSEMRRQLLEISPNILFGKAIHPSAVISKDVLIGSGTVVMAGAVINTATKIGEHAIINTSASIDHDCEIGEFSAIQPGAVLGGEVNLGEFCTIALGARVIHGIKIGSHTVIGAGATVLKNLPAFSVAYGSPAKVIRSRKSSDTYL